MAKRTHVYVDGFNLYYGCLKGTAERWLDLQKFCQKIFPANEIRRIHYYTALVGSTVLDPQKPERQQTYLRALETLSTVSIRLGMFRTNTVKRELASPIPGGPRYVDVLDPKEKGSDVNIATDLLADGFRGEYDVAIVVSNDSDLCRPIDVVRKQLGLDVIVVAPVCQQSRHPSYELRQVATFVITPRRSTLRACQFPDTVADGNGMITKPVGW